jgi:hypothetical protein
MKKELAVSLLTQYPRAKKISNANTSVYSPLQKPSYYCSVNHGIYDNPSPWNF